jgi:hypothetical protein
LPNRSIASTYALGLQVQDYRGERLISHGGGSPGGISATVLIPGRKVGFSIFSNAEESFLLRALRSGIADICMGKIDKDWIADSKKREAEGTEKSLKAAVEIDAKQAAGAEFALTQLFFEADDYLTFAAAARTAGVTMPIIPGIMPVTSLGRLRRIVEITGERMPVDLEFALEAASSSAEARAIGTAHAVALCRALVAGGAPSLHLYAFNEHETVLAVLAQLGEPA